MAEGRQTKQQIAQALIKLTEEQPFNKISVQSIAEEAKINRQTFYYHFADKRELLAWFYQQDALKFLTSSELTIENWQEQALKMLQEIKNKGAFYRETVECVPEVLTTEFCQIVSHLFHRLFRQFDHENELTEEDVAFYGRFFAYGCSGILLEWIRDGFQATPLTIATQLFRLAKDVEFFAVRIYETGDE